ncbi:ATP-binding cassette domain-containing protein [Paenibacillus sp. Soil750]|uniref:ATP-binding cassette domain-containing protein n=1 Tax=Paenibacillus sp. Soil750 TaxID=1736398 RepID=UPI0009E95CCB|nr:ABC transporter ATP-binding protein [Paenibacillus sp. Soil750]
MSNVIALSNVSKTYNKKPIIRDITLTLPMGKIIGIVGENGGGKSTLLKLIAGLLQPTGGSVTINGKKAHRRISTIVSYLSDQDSTYAWFTVKEAIAYQAAQFPDFNVTKAEEIMVFMQLEPTVRIRDLSKGKRSRAKIMLTLAREVPYILMDEPLSGLDPMVQESIVRGMISYLDLESQTLIMTSHVIPELESIWDSFIAIKDGTLLRYADVEELHDSDGIGITAWMKKTY